MIAIHQNMRTEDETENLNRLRNRVLYNGYKNSIVEWTLSDEWLKPYQDTGKRGTVFTRADGVATDEFHGEITAHPLPIGPEWLG